jgi:Bacterial protein of unknown function (DUF885)
VASEAADDQPFPAIVSVPPAPRIAGTAAPAAQSAVSDAVEYFFAQYPSTARRAGRHDLDGHMPRSCVRAADDMARLREAAASQLRSLPPDADPELRADLDAAARMADSEHFRATELGQAYLSPVEALAEADLFPYLRPYAPLADRLEAVDAHLSRLPGFLAEAGRNLPGTLPAGERMRGIEMAQAQSINIRTAVRQLAADDDADGDAAATERRIAAADAARASCADLARAVAAARPTAGVLGTERLAGMLRIAEGITEPPAELLDQANAEVTSLCRALDRAAAGLGANSRHDACESLKSQVSPGPATTFAIVLIDGLREFWEAAGVVSLDTRVPLDVRAAIEVGAAATVEFNYSPPLEQVRQPHVLYLPEPQNGDGRPAAGRGQYLNDPMLEIVTVHEAFAGHYVHAEATARGPSVIRACFPWVDGFAEGWAHYCEGLAVEHGLAAGRPLIEVAQLKSALDSAARLVSFLSVHLGRSTFAEAAARAAQLCGWSQERAAREVLAVVFDPGGAKYTLAKLKIRQWRQAAGAVTAPELRAFHDRIMRCGNAPLSTVWQYYLDGRDVLPTTTEAR